MSVLAVQSVQKLELVGDHRQLPAFVQNQWYNLESTMPSIKVSPFQKNNTLIRTLTPTQP